MRAAYHAYHAGSARAAQAMLEALANELANELTNELTKELTKELTNELAKTHPGAAGSLREGMAETPTVLRRAVPPTLPATLARTRRSTHAVESMTSISRDPARNVKRRRDGQMTRRRCAAGLVEASQPAPPRQRPPPAARTPRRPATACHRQHRPNRPQHLET